MMKKQELESLDPPKLKNKKEDNFLLRLIQQMNYVHFI